jgi:hypothetical protein
MMVDNLIFQLSIRSATAKDAVAGSGIEGFTGQPPNQKNLIFN